MELADSGLKSSDTSDKSEIIHGRLDEVQQKQEEQHLLIKKLQQEQARQNTVQIEQRQDIDELYQNQEEQQKKLNQLLERAKKIGKIHVKRQIKQQCLYTFIFLKKLSTSCSPISVCLL